MSNDFEDCEEPENTGQVFSKETEREALCLFLKARASATGETLTLESDSESPDFICTRPDGSKVGVEHTMIAFNSEQTERRRIMREEHDGNDNFELAWSAAAAISKKEEKRCKPHWKLPEATILVLDLPEGERMEDWPDESDLAAEFSGSGFLEIWISDHSSLETHGAVTAIGLYPAKIWGIQGQGYLWAPPYK